MLKYQTDIFGRKSASLCNRERTFWLVTTKEDYINWNLLTFQCMHNIRFIMLDLQSMFEISNNRLFLAQDRKDKRIGH